MARVEQAQTGAIFKLLCTSGPSTYMIKPRYLLFKFMYTWVKYHISMYNVTGICTYFLTTCDGIQVHFYTY